MYFHEEWSVLSAATANSALRSLPAKYERKIWSQWNLDFGDRVGWMQNQMNYWKLEIQKNLIWYCVQFSKSNQLSPFHVSSFSYEGERAWGTHSTYLINLKFGRFFNLIEADSGSISKRIQQKSTRSKEGPPPWSRCEGNDRRNCWLLVSVFSFGVEKSMKHLSPPPIWREAHFSLEFYTPCHLRILARFMWLCGQKKIGAGFHFFPQNVFLFLIVLISYKTWNGYFSTDRAEFLFQHPQRLLNKIQFQMFIVTFVAFI